MESLKKIMDELYREASENIINGLKFLFYGVFVFLGINTDVVMILFWLMLMDTVCGVMKAVRLPELKFSFRELRLGLLSKLLILFIPMSIALMGKGLSFNFKWFVTLVMDILIVEQGISIITNVLSIRQKKSIKNEDFMARLIHAVRSYLINLFNTLLGNLKNQNQNQNNDN